MRRIALDVTPELLATTGVARYSRELRGALSRRDDCALTTFAIGRRTQPVPAGTRHIAVPLRAVHASWRAFGVPRAERFAGPAEVIHSLDLVPPPTRLPLVVTVHDLVTVDRPELHSARSRRIQHLQRAALGRAAAIVTVSQSTAEELVASGIDSDRIHPTPNGLTRLPAPAYPPLPTGPFVLAVGTLEPRKGHELLIRAFARADVEATRLVFAGPTAGRADALEALARELGIGERLSVLGFVDDATLAALYRDATLLCLPSFGEGFGLPVLEAMAAGLPVLASDLPAIREVTGGGAVLFAPGDVDALTAALTRLLGDERLRAELADHGPTRAAAFTWDATAAATMRAYDAAIRRSSSET
jgi:glycosyltransferase involved in cell wall biosynthesis